MQEEKAEKGSGFIVAISIIGALLMLAIFILCGKGAKATNFSGSNVTYNEGQQLSYTNGSNVTYIATITKNYNYYYINVIQTDNGQVNIYNGCSLSGNVINCSRYHYSNNGGISSYTSSSSWTINTNNIVWGSSTYTILNPYQDGYNAGVAQGELNAANAAASTTNGSGSTYIDATYALDDVENEVNWAYVRGQNSVTNNPNAYGLYTSTQYNSYGNIRYSAGVTQGHNDVTSDPNTYGLYSSAQYSANYTSGYNAGVSQVENNPNDYNLYTQAQYNAASSSNYTDGYNAGVTAGTNTGKLEALNAASNATYGSGTTYTTYTLSAIQAEVNNAYSNGNTAGITTGQNNVTSNPNGYGLYTSAQYNANYTNGQLNRLNALSASGLGTNTTYNSYSQSNWNTEIGYINNQQGDYYVNGRILQMNNWLNYISTNYGTGTTYAIDINNYTTADAYLISELNYIVSNNDLYWLNYISSHGGSNTQYITYTEASIQYELQYIYNEGQNNSSNYINGQLNVLNAVSGSSHGTGVTYLTYNASNLNHELDNIYNVGRTTGVNSAKTPNELTKFIPRMLAGVGGAIYPILTYEVFGLSIMNFLVLFIGLAILYLILKFVL